MITRRELLHLLSVLPLSYRRALEPHLTEVIDTFQISFSLPDPRTATSEQLTTVIQLNDAIDIAYKAISSFVTDAINSIIDFVRNSISNVAELIMGPTAMREIVSYTPMINLSTEVQFERDIMKAIIFEERIHEAPPFVEFRFENMLTQRQVEAIGIGDSVGPSQIRVSLWAERYNVSREDLIDPNSHIPVMAEHVRFILRELEQRNLPKSPEWIGTLWNSLNADRITDYGRRVQRYYDGIFRAAPEFNPAP